MRGLQGRAAIVTGGAQGIGRGIVERLLAEGALVLAVDRNAEALAGLPAQERLRTLAQDLTAEDATEAAVAACRDAFGKVDIVVNNVGVGNAPPVHETTDAMFDHFLNLNLRVTFRLSRDALPELRRTRGAIVNIASSVGLSGYRRFAAYAAAKAGVVALTRNMAADYGPEGIRVNAVAPGIIATPLTAARLDTPRFRATILGTMPLGMTGAPEDIGAAVAFLASDDARFVTGQVLAVDGGQTASTYVSEEMVAAWEASQPV
ncbi:SDR family NAD(P)-dependent oxidoreductase [Ruixingdingia sedimenti]|uniref:SDR family NAD(P)-dependent oxidoreductase n=1 Tax=Ruixingdingia sedimenti TaxID=3073604 RepID=A0ABU1F2W0_9RHOB|nr:SDR family NAD(P)-dependent oxidoreductase [Xinfangfangia sp. LG-4]MDR5651199.1 SDR family NAD(P)-dependent oxidoreductase [Xinfangfangia sp. LG-4]